MMLNFELSCPVTIPTSANDSEGYELFCDIDGHPTLRLISHIGTTAIAVAGICCNTLLIYAFTRKGSGNINPYILFLAVLDFLLCVFYIACFSGLTFATYLRIEWLYLLLKDLSVHLYIASRIVQLGIPYILIANTADRLSLIMETNTNSKNRSTMRFSVIILVMLAAILVRIPNYATFCLTTVSECDLFESKYLMKREMEPETAELMDSFDIVINFFHTFVSFIILAVLNVFIIRRLRTPQARRMSSYPKASGALVKSTSEDKLEQKMLRCAIRTTIVIITSYLICSSVNFALYIYEVFLRATSMEFSLAYVVISDIGNALFVLSSTIRIFILYKYNPEMRALIKVVPIVRPFVSFGRDSFEKQEQLLI